MGRVQSADILANVKDLENLKRFASSVINEIVTQINGRLVFGENVQASGPHELNFSSGGVNIEISHGLGSVPLGFIVIDLNADMRVFRSSSTGTTWTDKKAFFQSSSAGIAKVFII